MMELDYKQVDVFTSSPFNGNPVGVVFNADSLSTEKMQKIANWTNLSETTFVQSSIQGDYKLRIFTPKNELAFAGHPTIGSAFAVLQSGSIAPEKIEFFQECNAGLVRLIIEDDSIHAQVPKIKILDNKLNTSEFEEALGCQLVNVPIAIDSGPIWAVSSLVSHSSLLGIRIDVEKVIRLSNKHNLTGITVYSIVPQKGVFVRTFAPIVGIVEDPVCGSGNAAVAAHIKHTGKKEVVGNKYTAYQGESLGRKGIIQIRYENDDILIGGNAALVIDGSITIE
jgi:PhzF family phenazine biosynthesis protein